MATLTGSEHVLDCCGKVGKKRYVHHSRGGQLEGGLLTTSGGHQNWAYSHADCGLQIGERVSDEPRMGKVQSQFAGSLQQQAGSGLPAFTGVVRGVWTEVKPVDAATGSVDSLE